MSITLICRSQLKSLFERMPAIDQILVANEGLTFQRHDYWTPALSIPLHCKTTHETIPAKIPYLYANPTLINEFATLLKPNADFKIGICWRGDTQHKNDKNRSPGIASFESLFKLAGGSFFTLQPGTRDEFLAAAGDAGVDFGREINESSFEEAAALIMNLDLVIACDTSIAHLAGALGKPVWIVLPFAADWRWLVDREDSPWYPTARLFRQTKPGDWKDVFQRVEQQLKTVSTEEKSDSLLPNALQMAMQFHQGGDFSQAERLYRQILEQKPNYAEVHSKLGIALRDQKKFSAAVESFQKALSIDSNLFEAHYKLGTVFDAQGQYDAAIKAYQDTLLLKPDYAEAHYNMANLLMMQGKLPAAVTSYQQAVLIKPDFAYAHCNLGSALADLNQINPAIASYRQALLYIPDDGEVHFNLGLLLLALGEYDEGWKEHEYRYHPSVNNPNVRVPQLGFPQWQGESLKDKTIVIWYEQGLGDTIQFSRYAAVLKQQQAKKVTLVCDNSLKRLFESLPDVDKILTTTEAVSIPTYDYWTFPLSIPLYCHATTKTIPNTMPYLAALPSLVEQWQAKLPKGKMRVGLVWKGSSGHKNDANRSIPTLQLLAPLWNLTDCQFVSLQKGRAEEEIATFAAVYPLTHLGAVIKDFADTAAIISQLDLVITIDTAVAHLAGAMGKPVWVMLPFVADWRWLMDCENSPWYPTARLFRQKKPGDWDEVFQRVEKRLKQVITGESQIV